MITPVTRRTFLHTSAATIAGVSIPELLTSPLWAEPLVTFPGIQLYTVDKELKADVDGTLKTIRSIGYKEVEGAGFLGTGYIKYKPILVAAKAAGVEHFFIEQEPPFVGTTAIEAATKDYQYLESIS